MFKCFRYQCDTRSCETNVDFPKAAADDVVTLQVKAKSGVSYNILSVHGSERGLLIDFSKPCFVLES